MYENNNNTNGYEGGQGNQNTSTLNGGYYQTSQSAPQAPQYTQPVYKKPKKKSSVGGFFKKALACASMGLCFGLFAGAGAYAVAESTGLLDRWGMAQQAEVSNMDVGQFEEWKKWLEENYPLGIDSNMVNTGHVTAVTSDVSDVVEGAMSSMVSIVNHAEKTISYFGQAMKQEETGTGTGIIVGENDTELLIATNYHVIEDAKKLTVHFIDDTDVEAVVKGSDPDMDLAVIAVSLKDMDSATKSAITIARLGDSESLKLGEPVIAIGNALGYGQSVTGGYVSALDREVKMDDGSKGTFIQTDAAINPGNSGGALLNIKGEVIGINSCKIGGTYVEGIGYAIPISAAQPILENLMTRETRSKVADSGYLGLYPVTVTSDVMAQYGMPEGVFVSRVDDGTPAADAGILRGDVIVRFDGNKLTTADGLRDILEYYAAGETVDVTVMRNRNGEYEEVILQVTLGSRADAE